MGVKLSPKEFIKLTHDYKVKLHEHFVPPCIPVWFATVEEDDEVLAYLSFDAAREEWTMLSADLSGLERS